MAKKVVYKDRYVLATGYPCFGCVSAGQTPKMHETENATGTVKVRRVIEWGDQPMPCYRLILERVKREAGR